jgi:hypothetical protein
MLYLHFLFPYSLYAIGGLFVYLAIAAMLDAFKS